MRLASGLFPCEARWEETPHPARYSRHPLPKREGLDPESFQASPSGRGWPAAGAFISRSGPGEGLLPKNLNTRSVLEVNFGIQVKHGTFTFCLFA